MMGGPGFRRLSTFGLSTITVVDGVDLFGKSTVDSCGTAASQGSGWESKDPGLRCADSYAAVFLIPGETVAVEAAAKVDKFLRLNALVPNVALATNQVVLGMPSREAVQSVTVGATLVGDVDLRVEFGVIERSAWYSAIDDLPRGPSGTMVNVDGGFPDNAVKQIAASGSRFVAILEISVEYYNSLDVA